MTKTTTKANVAAFESEFVRLETLRMFCEEHDELMGLAIEAAKDMDANKFDLYKGGTFHGVCLAIATASGVGDASFVEEIICEFVEVDY